jgi:hypothetical protein
MPPLGKSCRKAGSYCAYALAMANLEIRYDAENVAFFVGADLRVEISRDDAVVAPVKAVAEVSVASFEQALSDYEEADAATATAIFLSDIPIEEFDPDTSPRDVWLGFLGEHLTVEVGRAIDDTSPALNVETLLAPLLDRHGAEVHGSFRDDQGGHLSEIHSLGLKDSSRPMGKLYELGIEAQALLDAASGAGAVTAATARDLIRGGRAGALCGQPESNWIDAKEIPHRTDTEAAAFELAKDVAAFANTGQDALIVYGIRTSAGPGGDVLDALRPIELASLDLPALRNALRDRLVPLIADLEVSVVDARGGYGFAWIFIPAQPEYARPLLVRGAFCDGKVMGTHVSVPFRVGEDTGHWDASMIHSLIQAGRVALQGAGPARPRAPEEGASRA